MFNERGIFVKTWERKRVASINKYILISQVVFFLLIGVLTFRAYQITYENYSVHMPGIVFFIIILSLVPFLQKINLNYENDFVLWDFVIILIYIAVASFFLVREKEEIFQVVLLMPVIMIALKYGVKKAFGAAFLSIGSLVFISVWDGAVSLDACFMFSGIIVLLAWLLGNMTETEHAIRVELERLATHDELTDILNHRSFQNILDEELTKAKHLGTPISLILMDIDYFKLFNDAYGHQEGDQILKDLAALLKAVVGKLGYCARYGGEEFGVILPNTDIGSAKEIGERIRRRIEEHPFPGRKVFPEGHLTVSVGVAEFPANADNKEKLFKKADEALYRAKFVSKNRVESYYSIFDEVGLILKEEEKEIFNSISAFTMVINAKDRYTYGHSLRVMEMAKNLALRVEGSPELIHDLSFGALLHDIGKVEISREILNRPGKLTEDEINIFRQHPVWGADIVDPLKSLENCKLAILYHHENYDGTGYPEGIKGEAIPQAARILRIVDSFDAMTTDRPYKDAVTLRQALEEMEELSGSHYDPWLFKEFKAMMLETAGEKQAVDKALDR